MSDRIEGDRIDVATAGDRVREELVRFVRALRAEGAAVPANAATTAGRSLAAVGLGEKARVQAALRASLLGDSDDFETFDRLFETFWRRLAAELDGDASAFTADPSESGADEPDGGHAPLDVPAPDSERADAPEDGDDDEDHGIGAGQSIAESFAAPDADATGEAERALYSPTGSPGDVSGRALVGTDLGSAFRELTRALAGLQGRRFEPGTGRPDVRRALRASVTTGGTVPSVPERERRRTDLRALLLVDVSRSVLDAVDRGFLLDFLRQARRAWREPRVFLFDEDLREVTDAVDAESPTAAMAALEATETAWGGGTRIGESLARLRETAPDAVDRRTVTFVVSDGLEMGDVSSLERVASLLARRGKRLFWLNPLAAAESYEPTARGMAAARPYLDGLFAFAGPEDVDELARQLRRHGPGGRVGYEFDSRRATTTQRTATTQWSEHP